MKKNTKPQKTATEIRMSETERSHTRYLIGLLKTTMKQDDEMAKSNPAFAQYLKKPKIAAERKARQDHFAKLDPAFAQWLKEYRAKQRG